MKRSRRTCANPRQKRLHGGRRVQIDSEWGRVFMCTSRDSSDAKPIPSGMDLGPFVIEEKVSAVKWRVNGKVEHAFNLKLAHDQPDVGNADVPIRETRRVIPGRRARVGALLAFQPRGDVLDLI